MREVVVGGRKAKRERAEEEVGGCGRSHDIDRKSRCREQVNKVQGFSRAELLDKVKWSER